MTVYDLETITPIRIHGMDSTTTLFKNFWYKNRANSFQDDLFPSSRCAITPATVIYLINQHQFGADVSQSELSDRMATIEAKNLKQDSEISLLKMATIEDKKEINELKERVVYLKESTFKNLTTEKFSRDQNVLRAYYHHGCFSMFIY